MLIPSDHVVNAAEAEEERRGLRPESAVRGFHQFSSHFHQTKDVDMVASSRHDREMHLRVFRWDQTYVKSPCFLVAVALRRSSDM